MRTYKAVVIDDEPSAIRNVTSYLEMLSPDIDVVATASNPLEGITIINKYQPDVVFLDISMPSGTGFEMLNAIEHRNFEVIFVTAHQEHAVAAIRKEAFDYILKPLVSDEFKEVLDRLKIKLNKKNESTINGRLYFPVKNGIEIINVQDVVYCEADNVYTQFFLDDGQRLLISKPLKVIAEMLEDKGFIKSHRSFLVNLKKVTKFTNEDGGYLHFGNGVKVPVSNSLKSEIISKLT